MEISEDTASTIEACIVLREQAILADLKAEARRALERVKRECLDDAELVPVVTRYRLRRSILGSQRYRVHTQELGAWDVRLPSHMKQRLVLCSDGNLYFHMQVQDFWPYWSEHMMPIDLASSQVHKEALAAVKKLGVKGRQGIAK